MDLGDKVLRLQELLPGAVAVDLAFQDAIVQKFFDVSAPLVFEGSIEVAKAVAHQEDDVFFARLAILG